MSEKKIKNYPRIRKRRRVYMIIAQILVLCLLSVGTYAYAVLNKIQNYNLDASNLQFNDEVDASKYTGFTNVALFGLDSRDETLGEGNRSDAIIIASINNNTGKIKLVSVYRDTYLDVGGGEYNKANTAYSYGGPEAALNMINKSLDLAVDKYVSVSFGGLATAIDELGGLDIDMTSEEVVWMNGYIAETSEASGIWSPTLDDSEITDGVHHLNGIQATAYCRIRYTSGDDYKRTERQRIVVEKIFEKTKTMNIKQVINIANKVFPMTQTNMSLSSLIKLGRRLMKFDISSQVGFPFEKSSGYVSGAGSVVLASDLAADVSMLHKILFNEKDYSPSEYVRGASANIACTETTTPPSGEGYDELYYDEDVSYDDTVADDSTTQDQTEEQSDGESTDTTTPEQPVETPEQPPVTQNIKDIYKKN